MKKKRYWIIITLLGIIGTLGLSYAYYILERKQSDNNLASSKCFKLELANEKNTISLDNMYPISDEEGRSLTPYSFTITNTCDMLAGYTLSLEMLEGTTLNSKYLDVMVNNEEIKLLTKYEETDTVIKGSTEARILAKGTLAYNDSVDYTVRFWMDKDVEDIDSMNKYFASKIVINATPSSWNPKDAGYDTLHDAILANEYQTTPEDAISKIEAKGSPDLSKTAPIIKWQEKVESNVTNKSIIKASETMINIDENTKKLTSNDVLMTVYTEFDFDSSTGIYTLKNSKIIDPTKIKYESNTKYYFINDSIELKKDNYYGYSATSALFIYQILGAESYIKSNNFDKKYDAKVYNLQVKKMFSDCIESDKSDSGLYSDEDDFGTTYYYRGSIKNNNAYFAEKYWKILRINGDGSIRLLYNGGDNEGDSISISSFNTVRNSPIYVGYMYGIANSSNYESGHLNENSSTIKLILDDWYSENILSKNYENFISKNSGFCGNRTIILGDGISDNKDSNFFSFGYSSSPKNSFKCKNNSQEFIQNDYYTVNESNIGNKSLIYPIGLITSEDLIFSGMKFGNPNNLAFTYSTKSYWTMSPFKYDSSYLTSDVAIMNSDGSISGWTPVNYLNNVRPVINLKPDVKISGGIGTSNNPYIIETD